MEEFDFTFEAGDTDLAVMLQPARVTVKKSLAKVGSENVPELEEGKSLELPLWAADILCENGFVTVQEDPFHLALVKSLSRERLQPSGTLSSIPEDFYGRARRAIRTLKTSSRKEEHERLLIKFNDLVSIRTAKILNLSTASNVPPDFLDKMALEERALYTAVRRVVERWVKTSLEGSLLSK